MKLTSILICGLIGSFVLLSSFSNSVSAQKPDDKIVKIRNYGWYILSTRVDYELNDGSNKIQVQQKVRLPTKHDYTFYIPNSVSLSSGIGVVFTAEAIGGVRIFSIKIPSEPFCVYVRGVTLNPTSERVDCNKF